MSYPRKGSKVWKGRAKRLIYTHLDTYNRLFATLDIDARLKMTQKPRIGRKQRETNEFQATR